MNEEPKYNQYVIVPKRPKMSKNRGYYGI